MDETGPAGPGPGAGRDRHLDLDLEPESRLRPEQEPEPSGLRRDRLNGWSALLIFLAYVAAQLLAGLLVGAVVAVPYLLRGDNLADPEVRDAFTRAAIAPTALIGMITSAVVVVSLTWSLARDAVADRSETGIAWCRGESRMLGTGGMLGALFAVTFLPLLSWFFPPDPDMTLGPLAEMASGEGFGRWLWLFLAVLVAPPLEEFLFRGVLFAGFVRARGLLGGALLTSLLFTVMHLGEAIHYWPAFLGIGGLAVLTLALRIATRSLGPAIAAHVGYNLVIAAASFAASNF